MPSNPLSLDDPDRPLVHSKYRLLSILGKGSFCTAYLAQNVKKPGYPGQICIKIERTDDERHRFRQLHFESKLYELLRKEDGIPFCREYAVEKGFNFIAMELLGPTLDDLHVANDNKFSIPCLCLIAIQILNRLESLHKHSFIHRDLKPENFLIGRFKKSTIIYMCDLGLCKRYRDSATSIHIPFSTNRSLAGTARYASINALSGNEQSRRDDLESLGYMLVYFAKGRLPWQGLKGDDKKAKYRKICEYKKSTTTEQLCEGLVPEFSTLVAYSKSLKFEEDPNYSYMRNLFNNRLNLIKDEQNCRAPKLDWIERMPLRYKDILDQALEPSGA